MVIFEIDEYLKKLGVGSWAFVYNYDVDYELATQNS